MKGRRNLIVKQTINNVSHRAPMMGHMHMKPKGRSSKLDICAYDFELSHISIA